MYSFNKNLNDEDATAVTDAYWEFILKIGGNGIAAITNQANEMLLHDAAASRLSKNMMQRVIRLHPPALTKGSWTKQLPLHYACRWNSRVAAESLASAFPAALSIKDDDEKTPFEKIGDDWGETMTDDDKLLFKRATLRAIMEAHCRNNQAVLGYGTEKEVRIFITN